MHLEEMQSLFQQYLMGSVSIESVLAGIKPTALSDVSDRLYIYHHAYHARIREALSSQFPNLKKLLGTPGFEHYVDSFISKHPSTNRNMRWLGDKFGDFLYEVAPNKLIYSELANFEWQLGLAFDALDTPVITLQDLSKIAPEQWGDLMFQWHPSVYLGNSQTNVIDVWKALESDTEFSLNIDPSKYLIWRKDLISQFKSVNKIEADAITFMMQGHNFGELCELLATVLEEEIVLQTAAGLLSEWLQQEMLVALDVITPTSR